MELVKFIIHILYLIIKWYKPEGRLVLEPSVNVKYFAFPTLWIKGPVPLIHRKPPNLFSKGAVPVVYPILLSHIDKL